MERHKARCDSSVARLIEIGAVPMILQSPVQMTILCGSDGGLIYNDGYAVIAGAKHPKMTWRESGGPERVLPGDAGFDRVIMRAMPLELGGKATATYDEPGVMFDHTLPLENIEEGHS